jgi:hypothetical protein
MGASTLQNTLRDKCMALFLSEPYNEECNARMTSSATHARRNVLEVAFAECRLVAIRRWFPAEGLPLAALKVWRAAFPDEIPRGSPLMSPPAVGVGLYATGQSLEDERAQTLAYVAASRATLSNSRETS